MRARLDRLPGRRRPAGPPAPPDFIGVGALGSGTGWWHAMLLAHPEIRPPAGGRRALHFFDRFCAQEMTHADVAGYHARFPRRSGTITGEWTGRYMFDVWTPPLLRRAAPDAKLIVMVSDPIERYRAIFTQRLQRRKEGATIFMADVVDRRSFASQLARLRRFFDPERILVLQFEQCRREPVPQYRRTLEFLEVRDTGFAPRRLRQKSAGERKRRRLPVLGRLGLPEAARRRAGERLTGRPAARRTAPLWPDLEAALHAALDPEARALAEMVPELDLSLWPNFRHLAGGADRVSLAAQRPDDLTRPVGHVGEQPADLGEAGP